jgi:hypothetical protein
MITKTPVPGTGVLPTQEEAEAIERALSTAFNALEDVNGRLERLVALDDGHSEPPVRPTLEDVGELYSFATGIDSQVELLQREANRMSATLVDVNLFRLNLAVRGGENVDA